MSRQNHLLHFHISKKRSITIFDKVIIVAAFIYPLSGVPQILEVFSDHANGVSLLSWLGFIGFSVLFLAYGLVHKITPMVVTNGLWLVVDGLVVTGLILNSIQI